MSKADKAQVAEDKAPVSGAPVAVIEFNGLNIPVDAYFVSSVKRDVYLGDGLVVLFNADEPRQLPPSYIIPCLSQGIQLVK